MNNKYIILTAMYRYGILFMEDKPSPEQIRDVLTTTNPHTVIPGSKMIVKKALKDNYGINNREDMLLVVDGFMEYAWAEGIVYSALIDLFLNAPGEFRSMPPEQAGEYLSAGDRLLQYTAPFSSALEQFHLKDDFENLLQDIKITILDMFQEENQKERDNLALLFEKNLSWLSLTEGRSVAGFHLSRAISILADSQACGYLTDLEAEELLNRYGTFTETVFDNWQSFLASAVLGKQVMSSDGGAFVLDSSDYLNSCYKLAAHEGRLLEVSGLWQGSDTAEFCREIGKSYNLTLNAAESEVGEADPIFSFVQSRVLPVFQKYGVEYLLEEEFCELSYTVPVADQNSESYYDMEAIVKKKWFQKDPDEIPFIGHSKLLITSHGIRIIEKKLFSSRLHVFPWTQTLQFSYDFSKLDAILFKVNGMTMFSMPRNFKKAGISKKEDVFLEKEQIKNYYSEDIHNAILAFTELNQVLGNRQ